VAVETPAFFATSRMFMYGRDPLPLCVANAILSWMQLRPTWLGDTVTIAHREHPSRGKLIDPVLSRSEK
jgi:hypothetical protein